MVFQVLRTGRFGWGERVTKKVSVQDLRLGMYVHDLDRPWIDTPFLFQGFHIESDSQIEDLRHYCKHVYILTPGEGELEETISVESVYQDKTTVEEELVTAKEIHARSNELIYELVQDIREGSDLDVTKAKKVLVGMVDSMVRNPDALLLLTRLKDKDSYTYGHAIDVSIYMLAFGRHLGFPKDQLNNLGMGGMLLDIGKMQLPQALLEKRGKLTATEFEMVKRHVEFGIETLQKTKNIPGMVMEIVASHHERQDGSGYPLGLDKSKIGMFGSMGAIVDCYDALVSDRPYASPLTSYDALQSLYAWKGKYFHEHLVEQFIQCLGIYPVGSLVELNTGEVGVVIAQNRVRRMKPRIMLILDSDKKPYKFPNMLDLLLEPKAVGDQPYQIKRALEAGMYGIDPKEYYL